MTHDDALPAIIAGALFDLMGYLTCREERLTLSSRDEAASAVKALTEWAKLRGLSIDGARVQDWSAALAARAEDAMRADDGWRRECDDADAVLRLIGLDPEQCRTDGGSLNVTKIGAMLRDRAAPLAYLCPAGCGCTWRDNGDGSMSLYGPSSRSCAVCETMPLSKLLPVYAALAARAEPVACPHIRSSGTGDHATNWCALGEPQGAREAMIYAINALECTGTHDADGLEAIGDRWGAIERLRAALGKGM